MAHTFLKVVSHWINLDSVTRIEFRTIPNGPEGNLTACVFFPGGDNSVFTLAEEVQVIQDWLRTHAAT